MMILYLITLFSLMSFLVVAQTPTGDQKIPADIAGIIIKNSVEDLQKLANSYNHCVYGFVFVRLMVNSNGTIKSIDFKLFNKTRGGIQNEILETFEKAINSTNGMWRGFLNSLDIQDIETLIILPIDYMVGSCTNVKKEPEWIGHGVIHSKPIFMETLEITN